MAGSISFAGMASGLDTDSIVEAMVSNYQNKVDKSMKQETLLEWKEEAHKEVSNKVYKFYTGTINKLRLTNTFNQKLLTSSNSTAVKLDKSSTPPNGTHKLENLKMATSASLKTYQLPSSNKKGLASTTKLSELGIQDGESIELTDSNGNKTKITFKSTTTKENGNTSTPADGKKDVKEVTISLSENISALQSTLKTALPSANVSYDSNAGAFFISSNNTGEAQSFQIEGHTNALKSLGFTDGAQSTDDGKGNSVTHDALLSKTSIKFTGSDASYTYNDLEMKSPSNNININGLKFTITGESIGEPIIINSSSDVDGMVDTIKAFVDEYNTLLSELTDLVNADSAGSYEPLLDKEKEGLTDSQIDKWEKKVKDSLLRNDSTIKDLISSMRSVLNGVLTTNSQYKTLASIGITTSSDWTKNGKLELDEEKLREALTNNPNEVIELFTANGQKESDGTVKKGTMGIGDGLYATLNNSFKRISGVKSATSLFNDTLLSKQRTTQKKTTNQLEDKLEAMRALYLKKFTAMETVMSKLNTQTDALTALLNS